ncbi:MAG: hypothetical protein ACI9EQ_001171 [Bacteroidia bacterium]|jgi:hypothetical protein
MKTTLLSFSLVAIILTISLDAFAQPAPGGGVSPVITEIMYNPPEAGNDTLEFIEILNPSLTVTINMTGYSFSSGITYTFPDGFVLGTGEYVIVSGDSVIFEDAYGVPAFEWAGATSSLSNSGEGLALRNASNTVVDTVFFDDAVAWPSEADGDGYSLTLCDPTSDNNLPESWTLSENATGILIDGSEIFADPNAASTCTLTGINENEAISTVVYPNPTEGAFSMKFEAFENNGTLRVFNSVGQVVYTETIATGTSTLNINADLKSGFYILSLENDKSIERHNLVVK